MAYYDDGYIWPYQDPVSFSTYEPYGHVETNYDAYNVSVFDHQPKSVDYGDYGYGYDYECNYECNYDYESHYDYGNCDNWYSSTNNAVSYFAHNYMEPKLIAYEPVVCDTGYVSYHTQYSISYPEEDLRFNEPEFDEYDTTPYGGGYDIVAVYGKPHPPSNQTCYPRSKPKPIGPRPTLNSESHPRPRPEPQPQPQPQPQTQTSPCPKPEPKSMPMPIATPIPLVEPKSKPEPKPMPVPIATPIPLVESESESDFESESESEPELVNALVPLSEPLELSEVEVRELGDYSYPGYGYDYPWPEYDRANATGVGYDYGYGKQVVQIPPYEYSPEVVDFCESIFGNWPCLARIRRQQMDTDNNPRMSGPEIGQLNPWEECAGYIFGRPTASYNVC